MSKSIKMPPNRLLWLAVVFVLAMPWCMAVAQPAAPLLELSAGVYRIEAEVAATPDARDQGLMYRHSLPPDRGMLFVFPQAHAHCMWMRHTYIPLSVAFLDDRGIIINIAEMQPGTLVEHCAVRPVRYALEMNGGWFRRQGVGPGARIDGLEKAPPGR